jgi:hypothetical protein
VLVLAASLALPSSALGDGGRLQGRAEVGDRIVTVWTAPTPLRPGPIEVLVLAETPAAAKHVGRDPAAPVAELGDVAVEAWSGGALVARARGATAGPSARLARLDLPAPSGPERRIELRVAIGSEGATELRTDLPVAPPVSPLAEHWFVLTLPAVAVALFALRERRSVRARRAPAHST